MEEELKHVEFLANKSKELIEKQVNSYRQQHSTAGTIIGVTALFIPFFLGGLDNSYLLIQIIAVVPIILFIWAILIMLRNLRSQPLYQAFSVEKYSELVNESYTNVLLFEIGANLDSYRDNQKITERANKRFNNGVRLTTISILISMSLLLSNNFIKPDSESIKVHITNDNIMNKLEASQENEKKPLVIPTVPPKDRERLNEGVERDKTPPPSQPKEREKK